VRMLGITIVMKLKLTANVLIAVKRPWMEKQQKDATMVEISARLVVVVHAVGIVKLNFTNTSPARGFLLYNQNIGIRRWSTNPILSATFVGCG